MALTKGHARNAVKQPLDQRLADMALVVCNSDGSPRTGVLGSAATAIVSATAGWSVDVAAAEFATSKGRGDGVMIFTNNGTTNVALALAAAPATNSRIDTVWVKHNDDTTGDASALPVFGVTTGVAAASPVKSAIPTGALELAAVRIYAGTTATNNGANTVTNTYQMTAARGGIVTFRTKADLDLWTNPTTLQRAVALSTGDEYSFVSGSWGLRLDATWQKGGSNVTGIDVPTSATLEAPNGLIFKAGQYVSGTSVAFGNEYFPTITFSRAFPNEIMGISFTPISNAPITNAQGTIASDAETVSSFRAFVQGSSSVYVRGFQWLAWGI